MCRAGRGGGCATRAETSARGWRRSSPRSPRTSASRLQALLELAQVAADAAADHRRVEPQRVALRADARDRAIRGVVELVGHGHREWRLDRLHGQAPAGRELDDLVDVGDAPPEEAGHALDAGAD